MRNIKNKIKNIETILGPPPYHKECDEALAEVVKVDGLIVLGVHVATKEHHWHWCTNKQEHEGDQ